MTFALRTSLLPLALLALACGDDSQPQGDSGSSEGGSSTATTTASTTATTTASTTASTTESTTASSSESSGGSSSSGADSGSGSSSGGAGDVDVSIRFALRVGDQDAHCNESYDAVGSSGATVSFRDLRFYVSGVRLLDGEGNETPVELTQDGTWQYENVALLDFEDASGECAEGTNEALNDVVVGTVPAGEYTGVRFELGVPFELNHADAAVAPPPLNEAAMFWVWAAGYKFLRIDITNENAPPDDAWFIHLGSENCVSGAPTEPPTEACGRPGLPTITLDGFDPATQTIVGDIAALVAGEDVNADTPDSAPGCMSFTVDENECDQLFPALGLSWDTGACDNGCDGQSFFTVE